MKKRVVSQSPGYAMTYSEEDGQQYHGWHQDIRPAMKHVAEVRDKHSFATKSSNPNEWKHIGTVPIVMITDWLRKNGYTFNQWARNEGGIKGKTYPESKNGVKDKFMAYFMSRDFCKLHNMHFTTKSERSQILVPEKYVQKESHGLVVPRDVAKAIKAERAA